MTDFKMVIPVLIAFAVSVLLGPVIIPYLRKLKMGQTERKEGVQSHLKKAGTPTMGWYIFSALYSGDVPVLCERLSEDYSGAVSDSGLWHHRFSGRLFKGSAEALEWTGGAHAENGMPDCSYSNFCFLSGEIY